MSQDIQPTPVQVTTPTAVRIIVTYTAKVPPIQYSQLEASTMMIVDLPPDTTPEQASEKSAQLWRTLHEDYGDQFARIVNDSMNAGGWEGIEKLPTPVKSFATAVKAIWASIGTRLGGAK
jgi:hypothetical protein